MAAVEGDEPGHVASGAQGRAGRRRRAPGVRWCCCHGRGERSSAPASRPTQRQPDDQGATRERSGRVSRARSTTPSLRSGSKPDEMTLVHRGIVPAAVERTDGCRCSATRASSITMSEGTWPELISIVGVKYTTARVVAERAVDLVLQKARPRRLCNAAPPRRCCPARVWTIADRVRPVRARGSRRNGAHTRRRRRPTNGSGRGGLSRRRCCDRCRRPHADGSSAGPRNGSATRNRGSAGFFRFSERMGMHR